MRCMKSISLLCTIFLVVFLSNPVVAQHAPSEGTDANPADESQFLSNIRQLTYDGKRAGEGYFSEDGTAIIFQSERESENPFIKSIF